MFVVESSRGLLRGGEGSSAASPVLDCGANALTVCNTVQANVLLDSRSEWMAARGVEDITTHDEKEICVQYDRALHVHIAPPTRTQSLRDTIGLVHGVLEVDGSPVLLTTRLKGSATMSLPRKSESVRREPLRVDMVEALESGDCVEGRQPDVASVGAVLQPLFEVSSG